MMITRNRLLFIIISIVAFSSPPAWSTEQAPEPIDGVKILTIGNSFTANTCEFLPLFVQAAGTGLLHFPAHLGGASFERHVNFLEAYEADADSEAGRPYKGQIDPVSGEKRDFSLREALEATDWDYVTIQQLSSQSFRPDTFEPAHRLIAYIREHAPKAEILIHQTWTYHDDFAGYENDGFSIEEMHTRLSAAYQQLADRYSLRIIPVGNAFHEARQTPLWTYRRDPHFDYDNPPDGELPDQTGSLHSGYMWRFSGENRRFHLDYRHASDAGKYLGAAVWYEFLFGQPPPDNAPIPAGLTAERAADLRRIASEVILPSTNP
jgi:hypothetical protein